MPRRLLLLVLSTSLSLLLAEFAMRHVLAWLYPEPSAYSRIIGVPEEDLALKLAAVHPGSTRRVFIGDSFTETGEDAGLLGPGWGQILSRARGNESRLIGFSAAGPQQYLRILDRLRAQGYKGDAVLVLFLGNDFQDAALWDRLGLSRDDADASIWPLYRQSLRPLPRDVPPLHGPCWAGEGRRRDVPGWTPAILRATALYRAYQLAAVRARSLLGRRDAERAALVAFMRRSCEGPFTHEIAGRVFFDAAISPAMRAFESKGLALTLEALKERRTDALLSLVVIRPREDVCRAVHGLPARSYDAEVAALRTTGLPVFDPSALFARRCSREDLYVPDGHWNENGHVLFAQALLDHFAASRTSRPEVSPGL